MSNKPSRRALLQAAAPALAASLAPLSPNVAGAERKVDLPRLHVHAEGHYLQAASGEPFFWLGDTAWQLLQWLDWDDCRYYLNARARQGFSVIQMVALCEFGGVSDATAMGLRPFQGTSLSHPNPDYFHYLVHVVDHAAQLGLYVALLPTWGDKLTAPWGAGPRLFGLDNLQEARAYARYLARLLKDRSNVLWMLGGDRPARLLDSSSASMRRHAADAGFSKAVDWRPVWDAMAAGIGDEIPTPLILYHPQGGEQSTSVLMPDTRWLSVNGMQSGHGSGHNFPAWRWVWRDFAAKPAKPTLDLEQNYEDHPVSPWPLWDPANGFFNDADVRRQAYRSVFAGACGVTYGNHAVWQFVGGGRDPINHASLTWTEAMEHPGARQMIFLQNLMLSRPYFSRVPAPEILPKSDTERDSGRATVATRDTSRRYAFVYYPNAGQPVEINLTGFGKALRSWWFNPSNGIATKLPASLKPEEQSVSSPAHGTDWVLVVDDEASHFAPPGLASI